MKVFGILFVVVFIINQSFYNFCMKPHCVGAAFPKVLLISAILYGIGYWVKTTSDKIDQKENSSSK